MKPMEKYTLIQEMASRPCEAEVVACDELESCRTCDARKFVDGVEQQIKQTFTELFNGEF